MKDVQRIIKSFTRAMATIIYAVVFCLPAAAQERPMLISHGIDGSWYQPETDGQGFSIETLPSSNTIIVYWYTFNQLGGEREWYIAVGDINADTAELMVYRVEDGVFNQASLVREVQWGTAQIVFSDCTHARFSFESPLDNVSGNFLVQRLTPDVSCAATAAQAHVNFVTEDNSWLDARGSWVFEGCVELGPSESHGREVFRFEAATLNFDMDHYNAAGCQGPVEVQHMAFDLSRQNKVMARLNGEPVIANRVLVQDQATGGVLKQIIYLDDTVNPPRMTHGLLDGARDNEGYPVELPNLFFLRQP